MQNESINIRMLGTFEFENNGLIVNDNDNRSKKLWLLLGYLTYNHGSRISQERLLDTLWIDNELNTNPGNALKTLFHRARIQLDTIGNQTGKKLFSCKKGEYFINTSFPFTLDLEIFEENFTKAKCKTSSKLKKEYLEKAFNIYKGDFLEKFSSESWVIPISTYYHNMYIEIVDQLLPLVEAENNYHEAIDICLKANKIEKYEERFYLHLLQNLVAAEQYDKAVSAYHELSEMLQDNFGVKPSANVKALYQKALHAQQDYFIDANEIQAKMIEHVSEHPGALLCDYDFFCKIYQVMSRGLERNGNAIHILFLTVTDLEGRKLKKRSLETCTENLKVLISKQLRQSDIFSMCSSSQFVIMLPNASFENAGMISKRIEKSFMRQYPHSPAKLNFVVQPLLPPQYSE